MTTLKVGNSLQDSDVLWRYITLEKFIDLVESKSLHFSPLDSYRKSDPFEGYLPQIAMEAFARVSKLTQDKALAAIDGLGKRPPLTTYQKQEISVTAEAHMQKMKALHQNIAACVAVSCWNRNAHESEGMWGLYARNGIAIRTSVKALKSAIKDSGDGPTIYAGAVKYLDFANPNLKAPDCVTEDGQMIGMLKRIAYAHENEVRMYISPQRSGLELRTPIPIKVPVDVNQLLEQIVISPFAGEAIERSVRAICRWGGVNDILISRSTLLDNCEYLLDVYK
ncbi:DUF2971 domain-containing protein [Silvimonas soli]|uniref:DUF2971 domain-containing protein n=1 Tax=Silvimonas soli TaxID=2980100 RepID=UPI0024B395E4|nr:DUF2971 domain-containing protein [Silvimonas soli]